MVPLTQRQAAAAGMDLEQYPRLRRLMAVFEKESVPVSASDATVLLPPEAARRALWQYGVYPSKAQIFELHMALGHSEQCVGLPFHEFCLLVTFLQALKRRSPRGARVPVRRPEQHQWDVFLGGACNPTTWRSDEAVPFCEREGVSYFNPQVADWSPELVEAEAVAKDTSLVNLFVLDERVRGTSTMVEMGYLCGAGYNMIPVMPRLKAARRSVGTNEEYLSDEEEEGLRRAVLCLSDLLERRGYPVFCDLQSALRCTKRILSQSESATVLDLTEADGAVPVFDAGLDVGSLGAHLLQTFLSHAVYGSDKVTASQMESILAETVGRPPPAVSSPNGHLYSFPEVALLVAAHSHVEEAPAASQTAVRQPSASSRLVRFLLRFSGCLVRSAARLAGLFTKPLASATSMTSSGQQPDPPRVLNTFRRHYDVYLGGSCGDSQWREEAVIPRLRAAGVSFFNPQTAPWHPGLQPAEACARELSRVLLFAFTRDTLAAASLVEAAHFIGRGLPVVLFVDSLPEEPRSLTVGFPLSQDGLKDYARARHYLIDVAQRCGVPNQPSVEAAADTALSLLQAPG